jgi:3',5'-cyclic AMP phosphodiesterase CpdA
MDSTIQSSSLRRPERRRSEPLLIAQITDIHLGFDAGNPLEMNRTRLDSVLREIAAAKPTPDIIIASGDLTEAGAVEDYRTLRELFDACPVPVLPMMGNHDLRETFRQVFPEVPRGRRGPLRRSLPAPATSRPSRTARRGSAPAHGTPRAGS